MKTCTQCCEIKPAAEFHRNPMARDGLHSWCKPCAKKRNAERWAAKSAEEREVVLARTRRWRQDNPEAFETSQRATRVALAERLAGQAAQYDAERRGCSHVEFVSPLVVLELHDGVCGICGEDVDSLAFELDHVVPIPHGGYHTLENLQPAHPACNKRKGSTLQEAA